MVEDNQEFIEDNSIFENKIVKKVMRIQVKLFNLISKYSQYALLPIIILLLSSNGIVRFLLCGVSIVLFIGLLYQLQDRILYHPEVPDHSKIYVSLPPGVNYEIVNIKTKDNETIHGYFLKHDDKASAKSSRPPTMVYFHGNAGNAGSPCCLMMHHLCCSNILSIDYRGYGRSSGIPSEEGLYIDAEACVKYLNERSDIDTNKIVIFGHSLGGAVAIHVAAKILKNSESKLAAVIVENTFTSIKDVGVSLFKNFFPFMNLLPHFFYKNKFESKKKIASIRIPMLFIKGEKDQIVCPTMTNSLYNIANNPKSCILSVQGGNHNDTWCASPHYHNYLNKFLAKIFNEDQTSDWKWEAVISI